MFINIYIKQPWIWLSPFYAFFSQPHLQFTFGQHSLNFLFDIFVDKMFWNNWTTDEKSWVQLDILWDN